MARITVLGGTGYAGAAIAAEAAKRGHDIVAVSRTAPEHPIAGIEYVTGSALDPGILDRAVAGSDVVIEAVSPRGDMAGKEEGLVDDLIARVSGTATRLGIIGGASSLLVEEGGPTLFDEHTPPPEVRPEVETGMAILATLRHTSDAVDWFYVSPPQEFGSWVPAPDTGSYRLGGDILLRDADGRSVISAADLARAVIDEIEAPAHHRTRFTVAH